MGNYKIKIECPNCKYKNEIKIPKGEWAINFFKDIICTCDNCKVEFKPELK